MSTTAGRRSSRARLVPALSLALALALPPGAARAQCMMMGGGGHAAHATKKAPASEKKLRQALDLLLQDDHGRALLADALLADADFMRDFVPRLAAVPEWRTLAAQPPSAAPPAKAMAAVYTCPMHPDVTSDRPGTCPKCGMSLEKADSQ